MSDEKLVKGKIQFKRDTADNWKFNEHYIPAAGEPCFCIDTNMLKIGNGILEYKDLPYIGGLSAEGIIELQESILEMKAIVGDKSIPQQVAETISNMDVVSTVSMNGIPITTSENNIDIPIASESGLGVVAGSDEISIDEDGKMNVEQININKLTQDEDDYIVFNSGSSNIF